MREEEVRKIGSQGIIYMLALCVFAAAGTTGLAEDQAQVHAKMVAVGAAGDSRYLSGGRTDIDTDRGEQEPSSTLAVSFSAAWDSHYVSEGRDNLDGESLAGTTVEADYKGFSLGGWYAASPDVDYREINIFTAYMVEWEGIEAYVSYTHLMFLTDEEHDNEAGAGIAYTALPGNLALGLDGYYSFEAEGCFYELCLGGEYEVQRITFAPSAILGLNSGYIADGHDGANNFALLIEASTPIKDGLDLVVHVAYTWGMDSDPEKYPGDETLNDFAYMGVALHATF